MVEHYKYTINTGAQVLRNKKLLIQLDLILTQYDYMKEGILQYLDESSIVCCMLKNSDIIGFSWIAMCQEEKIAELCWLVMDKNKSKGLEGKKLLDKVIEYCKTKNISSLKFNCAQQAWRKIKNEHKLLTRFGYNLSKNEKDYDISINI